MIRRPNNQLNCHPGRHWRLITSTKSRIACAQNKSGYGHNQGHTRVTRVVFRGKIKMPMSGRFSSRNRRGKFNSLGKPRCIWLYLWICELDFLANRASLKDLSWVVRMEPVSSVSGQFAVFWQAALLATLCHQI